VTGEQFAQRLADELGVAPLAEAEIGDLLGLASTAAHASERLAAPLCTFLAGRSGRPPAEVRAAAERLAASRDG
jgi:hypothetical protein